MSRIKGRYVAQVVFELDTPRKNTTGSLEEIRHYICDGDMKIAITDVLADEVDDCTVTVEQMYADVYEVDDDGTD